MRPTAAASEAELARLRRQYHFRPGPDGLRAWDVHRLIRLARALPVIEVPLSDIRELDQPWWFQHGGVQPTPRAIVGHVRLMDACDLRWPIVLSADGGVMDGMHRVAQALRLGHTHIGAQRFAVDPAPDHVGVAPDDLPYGSGGPVAPGLAFGPGEAEGPGASGSGRTARDRQAD